MKEKGMGSEKGQRPWFKKRQEELESTRVGEKPLSLKQEEEDKDE